MTERQYRQHPAKYSDEFIPIFAEILKSCSNVLDPFAGVGKIAKIKDFGFTGKVYANDIEREWLSECQYDCDVVSFCDAENLSDLYPSSLFDAICTSPTYGNRLADHHHAKDGSRRTTYTHCLGHELQDGNTGKMQWGKEYRSKHEAIYQALYPLLKTNGLFVLNISNHIRNGQEIDVVGFHKKNARKPRIKTG